MNNDWVETDFRHRTVNFAGLSHRNYRLEVEATNRNGDWASKTSLLIRIPHYFYQTVGFRLSVFLLGFLVIGMFIFMYLRQIRLKALQQQEELKLESLRGQMNPHFIFNSLNSINYFISRNDRLSANRYIADFSRLIRSILGNMSNQFVPFEKELESLNDYLKLEHLRFSDKFDYRFEVDESIDQASAEVFPGMVQPFVENAIWHGVRGLESRKGMVIVRFYFAGMNRLQCTVEDDGVGRKLSEERKSQISNGRTSRGIGIVLERLNTFNRLHKTSFRIHIEDLFPGIEETGTRVTIDIPVNI